ncbi:7604_t:CDS:1, partial [Acaulospora morrowiae]
VTKIETISSSVSKEIESTHSDILDAQINKKYCGIESKNGCRFLFAYCLPEQETSSNRHFITYTRIARKLNRTMVLTNVGQSRIRSDRMLPFSFYYDVEALRKKFPDVKFITQEDFRKWTKERHNKPGVVHARIERIEPKNTANLVKPELKVLRNMREFDFKFNNSTSFLQLNVGDYGSWASGKGNKRMLRFLISTLNSKKNEEVMLIVHDRKTLIKIKDSIPYAKHLVNAAEKIINGLGEYIAIHWRMEGGEVTLMTKCTEQLVTYLKNLTSKTGINNIYFATDYPLSQRPQSDTFHKLSNEHHQAVKILNSSFYLNTWVSTHSLDYLKEYTALLEPLEDELRGGGLQGILDKLVLIKGSYFISGPKGCCRTVSKYTRRVADERKKLINKGVKRIKNKVDRWWI